MYRYRVLFVVCLFVLMLPFACLLFVGVVFEFYNSMLGGRLPFRVNADVCVFVCCCGSCVCCLYLSFLFCKGSLRVKYDCCVCVYCW